jgi:hypothetical protein
VRPSWLTVGGSPARAIDSKIRRVLTLTARGGCCRENPFFVLGYGRLHVLRAGLLLRRRRGLQTGLYHLHHRCFPHRCCYLRCLLQSDWFSGRHLQGVVTCNKALSCGILAQDGTHYILLFCSKVSKPVQKSGKCMYVSLLICSTSQLRHMSCT